MQPVAQMVGLTPAQGPGAVGEHTAAVADGQGDPLGGLDDPIGPADLQRLGRSPTQDRREQGECGLQPPSQLCQLAWLLGHRLGIAAWVGGWRLLLAGGARWMGCCSTPLGPWVR